MQFHLPPVRNPFDFVLLHHLFKVSVFATFILFASESNSKAYSRTCDFRHDIQIVLSHHDELRRAVELGVPLSNGDTNRCLFGVNNPDIIRFLDIYRSQNITFRRLIDVCPITGNLTDASLVATPTEINAATAVLRSAGFSHEEISSLISQISSDSVFTILRVRSHDIVFISTNKMASYSFGSQAIPPLGAVLRRIGFDFEFVLKGTRYFDVALFSYFFFSQHTTDRLTRDSLNLALANSDVCRK
jgi:hypothetical protein